MKNALSIFAVAIGSAMAAKLNTVLADGGLDQYMALFTAVVASTASATLLKFALTDLPMCFQWSRKILDKRATFEGFWIQQLPLADTPVSIGVIEFDTTSQSYSFKGWAFDTSFKLFASWTSSKLDFDLAKGEITYSFEAQMTMNNETIHGYGKLEFALAGKRWPQFGTGYFLDSGTNVRKVIYDLHRLSRRSIFEILSKGEPDTAQDVVALVKHFSDKTAGANIEAGAKQNP